MALTAEERTRIQSRLGQSLDAETIDFEPELDFVPDIQGQSQQAKPSYEQAQQQTEQQISERPSSIDYLRQVLQNPYLAQQHPFRTGLSALSAPFEAGESIPANIGLALQRGDVSKLPQQLVQGFTGERPAQIGDIYRASGVPALQAMGAPAGLLLTGGTRSLANTGATAKLPTAIANIIRSTTSLPSKASQQVLGLPFRVSGKISKSVIQTGEKIADPLTNFPMRKTLEIRQGLIDKYHKLNTWYGDEFEKLSKGLQGVLPTPQIAQALQKRLQEAGVLDQSGNLIPDALDKLTRAEREILQTYEDLATHPSPTVPFNDITGRLKHFRTLIRKSARDRNTSINADERIVYGVIHDIAQTIGVNNTSLLDLNTKYAPQRQFIDTANKIFKIYKGEYDTKSGEYVLRAWHKLDGGTQKLLEDVEKLSGVRFVEKAKAFSAAKQLLGNLPVVSSLGRSVSGASKLIGQGIPRAIASPGNLPGQVQAAALRAILQTLNK